MFLGAAKEKLHGSPRKRVLFKSSRFWVARSSRSRPLRQAPSLLPFVVVASDFEDAQIWHASTRPLFCIKVFNAMSATLDGEQDSEGGKLPQGMAVDLRKIFGCPFEEYHSILDRLWMDQPPVEYRMDRDGRPRNAKR